MDSNETEGDREEREGVEKEVKRGRKRGKRELLCRRDGSKEALTE